MYHLVVLLKKDRKLLEVFKHMSDIIYLGFQKICSRCYVNRLCNKNKSREPAWEAIV